ncbi:MAG: hypothetical protein HYV09_33545 [Deltaproteobacteria bacterium]|nr:hypothetical protein [Deltaproteobacteria bacterium]
MGSWQIEMLWRCSSCAHRNRGRELICGRCGSPKDGSETYEMPDDTSREAAVEDRALLQIATAGENWRCAFCGSDQRALDGSCARCGAGRAPNAVEPMPPRRTEPSLTRIALQTLLAAAAPFVIVGVPLAIWGAYKAREERREAYAEVEGTVTAIRWSYDGTVERHLPVVREGFAESKPSDATDVKLLGDRVHHHDSVQVGTKTVTYDEKVSDGTTTESTTVREACGQTCTSKAPSCRRVCKSNKNGFATCDDVCTGGGQTCSTKYCDKTVSKQVPRYKTVTKTKVVGVYQQVPRYAPFYVWRQMAWVPFVRASVSGDGNVARPLKAEQIGASDAGLSGDAGLAKDAAPTRFLSSPGEFTVHFRYPGATSTTCAVKLPDAASLRAFAVGTKRKLAVSHGQCTILGPLVTDPLPPETPGTPTIVTHDLSPTLAPPDAALSPAAVAPDASSDVAAD